jgi:hypothetical protein
MVLLHDVHFDRSHRVQPFGAAAAPTRVLIFTLAAVAGIPTAHGQAGNECVYVEEASRTAMNACCVGKGHRRFMQQCGLPPTCAGTPCATAFTEFFASCEVQLRAGLDGAAFDSFATFNEGCRQIMGPSLVTFATGSTTPVVTQTATSEYGITFRLSLELSAAERNVYTIYAASDSPPMNFPPAFNSDLGGDFGVSPVSAPEDAYDSWITIGNMDVSSLGIDVWSTNGLSVTNGAVFVMDPMSGPSGTVLIAQMTVPCGEHYEAVVNAQGLSSDGGNDWRQEGIEFTFGTDECTGQECQESSCINAACTAGLLAFQASGDSGGGSWPTTAYHWTNTWISYINTYVDYAIGGTSYNTADGQLHGWGADPTLDVCLWTGVSCHPTTGAVAALDLNSMFSGDEYRAITGDVGELAACPGLQFVELYGTGASGDVAPLAGLTQLTHLSLRACSGVSGSSAPFEGLNGMSCNSATMSFWCH